MKLKLHFALVAMLLIASIRGFAQAPPAIPVISYFSPLDYPVGTIGGNGVESPKNTGGAATNFTITPALPRGMIFSSTTGVISGLPAILSPYITYTIIASNVSGSDTTTLKFESTKPSKPHITYPTPQSYTLGVAITNLTPTNSSDQIPSTAISGTGFNIPKGLAVDATGNIYVADNANGVVKEIPLTDVTPFPIGSGFTSPTSVALDSEGDVYVADSHGGIYKVPAGGGSVVTITTNIVSPYGIAVDAPGNVYVSDFATNAIKKIAPNGTMTTLATGFSSPCGVAVDTVGNIYVADRGNNAVKEILASNGSVVQLGTGFSSPNDVKVDAVGNVYVADMGNNAVKVIKANGGATLLFSNTITPSGIGMDKSGNIYISTTNKNNVIIIFNPSGYSISPALPNGLVLDPVKGIISGTATNTSPATNYTVSASNLGGTFTTTISIAVNAIKTLSTLSLSAGTLSPVFASNIVNYSVSEANTQTSVTITATPTDSRASVTVNGNPVSQTGTSPAIPLAIGSNNITVIVTNSGQSQTYTINATRADVAGATSLLGLKPSKGILNPAFSPTTVTYNDVVTNGTTSVTFAPTTTDPKATVKVNGTVVAPGKPSAPITLTVGTTVVSIVITSADGTYQQTYTVDVIRPSTNAKLSAFSISAGLLSPAFNTNTTGYAAAIANNISSLTITPTAAVAGAIIKVNGLVVNSGNPSGAIPLTVGNNTITTVVTAQDGVTNNTYTLTVTRAASTNCNLSTLTTSKGTLNPVFAAGTIGYTDMESNGTTSVTFTPTTQVTTSTVTINGEAVLSAHTSGAIPLAVGSNIVTTVVTAQDGITKRTYLVNVIRPSTNAKLSDLIISAGTLTPAFNANNTSYKATVNDTTSTIKIIPTVAVSGATIKINNVMVTSGIGSGPIALSVGSNTINIVVTAQDGATTYAYTLLVTRAASGENFSYEVVSVEKPLENPQFVGDEVTVHTGISPNGDGINDYLQIDNISNYPDNKLSIVNRNGMLVYEFKGYNNNTNAFDGHSNQNGHMLLPGTYFYSLDYIVKGVIKHKTGFLVLKY